MEIIAVVLMVVVALGTIKVLPIGEQLACTFDRGVSAAFSADAPDACDEPPPSARPVTERDRTVAGRDQGAVGNPDTAWTARTYRAGSPRDLSVKCVYPGGRDGSGTCVKPSDRQLLSCSGDPCSLGERVKLSVFDRCVAGARAQEDDEKPPARMLCAWQAGSEAGPRLVECVSDPGGVWGDDSAARCTDTSLAGVDPGAASDAVSDCRVLGATPSTPMNVDADWACTDWAGNAYACSSDTELPVGADPTKNRDVREAAGRRAQSCPTRTFSPGALDCDLPDLSGLATCRVDDDLALTCSVLPGDAPSFESWGREDAPGRSSSAVRAPTNCVRAGDPSLQQRLLQECADAVDARPQPRVGGGRALGGIFEGTGTGTSDSPAPPRAAMPVAGRTSFGALCADSPSGSVVAVDVVDPPASGPGIPSPTTLVDVTAVAAPGQVAPPAVTAAAAQVAALAAHAQQLAAEGATPSAPPPVLPPVPLVVVTSQMPTSARVARRADGAVRPRAIFLNPRTDAGDPAALAHEYGHVVLMTSGFYGAGWEMAALSEGLSDAVALLTSTAGSSFTVRGREKRHVARDRVSPSRGSHHNGTMVLNVFQNLAETEGTTPGQLFQLLLAAIVDPSSHSLDGFASALVHHAPEHGLTAAQVETALGAQDWTVDPPSRTCSGGEKPSRGPDPDDPGSDGPRLPDLVGSGRSLPMLGLTCLP